MGCFKTEDDEDPDMEDDMNKSSEKCKWLKFGCGRFRVEINPLVTLLSAAAIWVAVIVCMVRPVESKAMLEPWMPWITRTWTWLYIGTQDIWFVLICAVAYMKYGKIKLGKDDEKPEYSNASYFCMLFAAGIAIGLITFGVSETMYHYQPGEDGHRFYERYNDNQQAQDAMNLTLFHWGIHGWIVYVLVGLTMGISSYRFGLTMSIRSCFYPIIGEHIYGLAGDVIDSLSVVATMFGVCTSLGLGTMQINAGLHRLNRDIEKSLRNQLIIIWSITAVATVSVVTGLKYGIRRISEVCFYLGMVIMMIVLFQDDTWYLLNNYVQSIGYYLQHFIQLGFHCDTFSQMNNSMDARDSPKWIGDWTIFYWGWWIAWAPFTGMFIAKISRGRTIRDFVMYTMTIPCLYIFFWFCVFGGLGIKMEREAFHANIDCDSDHGGEKALIGGGPNSNLYRLSCRDGFDMWFDVMSQYQGTGYFLSICSVISLVLYFVTSSDSGSLVIDSLSANGHPDPPCIQRIFWAVTEGACATGLLVAGGENALKALQTVSIAAGLVYTILLNFMAVALWRLVKVEFNELDLKGPTFSIELLDMLYNLKAIAKSVLAILIPWYFIGRANALLNKSSKVAEIFCYIFLAVLFYGFIVLVALQVIVPGIDYIGWTVYLGFATWSSGVRMQMRTESNINGNMLEDFFACLIPYPLTAVQMYEHMQDMREEDISPPAATG